MQELWEGVQEQKNGDKAEAISVGMVVGNVRWQMILWASSISKDMAACPNAQPLCKWLKAQYAAAFRRECMVPIVAAAAAHTRLPSRAGQQKTRKFTKELAVGGGGHGRELRSGSKFSTGRCVANQ